MNRKTYAFGLNFLIPGAGLLYLGEWASALVNFFGVVVLSVVLAVAAPEAFAAFKTSYLLVTGMASGLWAYRTAERQRRRAAARAAGRDA